MSPPQPNGHQTKAAIDELKAVQIEIAEAADAILFATETSLARLSDARSGESGAFDEIERALCAILGACAFQDISGQRLFRVESLLTGAATHGRDGLARGPALGPDKLDQAAADALFAQADDPLLLLGSTVSIAADAARTER